jgi:hypothetical protein
MGPIGQGNAMTVAISDRPFAWWKEPTNDQWLAFSAGFLGWMLDAFDFTIFLIMMPISQEFGVSWPWPPRTPSPIGCACWGHSAPERLAAR